MATIESIKQRILQLDAGSFQNLCDSYLYKIGYPNIVSLGSEAGSRKTTPGTPDTYFYTSDGRYVFVEYTTQKENLVSKIKDDIKKCLEVSKTGITHDKISEIIYCHTSSNIKPSQDNELRTLCEDVGINLILIGIDQLAGELYLYHHSIVHDFLDISISTHQIQSCDDFIKQYNYNRMAAPIDTTFLFRDKEIDMIHDAYQKADVVILNGVAGAGKTRLALHYAKTHSETYNEKFYCIHSNALPIYEDLKLLIGIPGNYFLVIDDANQLSGLQHVIRCTTMKPEGYNVKMLITVRDYAIQKVINNVREIAPYEIINIGIFTDDEINKLLENALGITNPDYQERIIRIAEGNARIAILAGKLACNSNRLDSINDVSQLYEDYYYISLQENQLLNNDVMCITAGMIAFLEAIHLDYIDSFMPILLEKGLTRDIFIENIRSLHEKEIVDICNDKAVRFSEQCLSNYLLKYVFFDKKLLNLSSILKACFQNYKERTISSINTLLNIFRNELLYQFVENEIKTLWEELSLEKSLYFFEFVKVFFRINPTEALLLLQEKIELENSVNVKISDIDTETGKNYKNITNDIIKILGGFADMVDLPTALDLFFQYYLKRPDLYMQFYHAANQYYGIKKASIHHKFYTQISFFEKLKEYSDDWTQESIVILFFELASEFLSLCFHPMEEGRKHTFNMYTIPITLYEGTEKYRGLVWDYLYTLSKIDRYRDRILKILNSYGRPHIEEANNSVMKFDLTYIKLILEFTFPASELRNCLLVDRLMQIFARMGIDCESLFAEYFVCDFFHLYRLLKGPSYNKEVGFNELRRLKEQAIKQCISNYDLIMFKRLIDVCYEINDINDRSAREIIEGLRVAFDTISERHELYFEVIEYYIQKGTPLNLHPSHIINNLFLLDSKLYYIICKYEYSQKNEWIYAYYHELPKMLITERHLQGLYEFLTDTSDGTITSSSFRDVDFLENYSAIDKDAFAKGCEIILAKIEYSPFIAHIYFDSLFNIFHNTPQALIQKFSGDLELLEKIYCAMLLYDNQHDYDGIFLKEIYLYRPSILDKYIDYLIKKDSTFSDYTEKNHCLFSLDKFQEIFDIIFEQLVKGCQFPTMSVPYFLESLLLPVQDNQELLNKQDIWIRHCIQFFYNDTIKMYCLFSIISKLINDRKKDYICLFLEYNQSFEDFKEIPLTPTTCSWSGSAIPMYSAWIEFIELLLPNFIGLKWIKHKNYLETEISYLKRQIKSEQIEEILRG